MCTRCLHQVSTPGLYKHVLAALIRAAVALLKHTFAAALFCRALTFKNGSLKKDTTLEGHDCPTTCMCLRHRTSCMRCCVRCSGLLMHYHAGSDIDCLSLSLSVAVTYTAGLTAIALRDMHAQYIDAECICRMFRITECWRRAEVDVQDIASAVTLAVANAVAACDSAGGGMVCASAGAMVNETIEVRRHPLFPV